MTGKVTLRRRRPRGEDGEIEYAVWRDGVFLGVLVRRVEESWRMAGRLRTSRRGYARSWHAQLGRGAKYTVSRYGGRIALDSRSSAGVGTRAEALELLLTWHDHPELREVDS